MQRPILMSVPGGSDSPAVDPQAAKREAWATISSCLDAAAAEALSVNGLTEPDADDLRQTIRLIRRVAGHANLRLAPSGEEPLQLLARPVAR
jgi:hypothetical protein